MPTVVLKLRKMNDTVVEDGQWYADVQSGNPGAALFIIAYIGFYGLGILCFFGHQLNETHRQSSELPATFLKTLWDVPSKNKLYGLSPPATARGVICAC